MNKPVFGFQAAFLCMVVGGPLNASISIRSFAPSVSSPQPLGTPITFTATATDTSSGTVAFQFKVAVPNAAPAVVRNFNIGTKSNGAWTSQPFMWASIVSEGSYTIEVTAMDFPSGAEAQATLHYTLESVVAGGKLTAVPTANPLVGLAAIPPCPVGSTVRAVFRRNGSQKSTKTGFTACHGNAGSNIYLGGMQATTTYNVSYQIQTAGTITAGPSTATFTTGQIPTSVAIPATDLVQPPESGADLTDDVLLHAYLNLGTDTSYQPLATDLQGNTMWYFESGDNGELLTRPLSNGRVLLFQRGIAWSTGTTFQDQLLREVDLAGNVVKETNIGLLQQQLLALGATDLQSCGNVPIPAPVGSGCLTSLSHDAILLPNGYIAFIGNLEKIFPPGTQGNTSGLNVEVLGDAIIVINTNLDAVWYWDAFQHDGGGNQLDINRPAILGEICTPMTGGCGALFLYGTPGVATPANDWLHSNSLYYEASDGDLILSIRHQDWVVKIDYNNGSGSGDLLWRLGNDGDFTFDNVTGDPYPWLSHQHDAGIEVNGVMTLFDNGNTRVSVEGSGNSRGMALNVDQTNKIATPVLSQDLGYYASALGSAQLLDNGNYHFQPGIVGPDNFDYSQEYVPNAGTTTGSEVYNLEAETSSYRSFRMPDMYTPPTT